EHRPEAPPPQACAARPGPERGERAAEPVDAPDQDLLGVVADRDRLEVGPQAVHLAGPRVDRILDLAQAAMQRPARPPHHAAPPPGPPTAGSGGGMGAGFFLEAVMSEETQAGSEEEVTATPGSPRVTITKPVAGRRYVGEVVNEGSGYTSPAMQRPARA